MTFLTHRPTRLVVASSGLVALLLSSGVAAQAQIFRTDPSPEPAAEAEPTADPEATPGDSEDGSVAAPTEPVSRFACQIHNGQPTVMYAPSSQPDQMYPWAVPQDMGSAWPAARRCEAISARLESYRPDGLLTLDTSVENGYNTVCVTTEAVSSCRIVFTVPPGQDPTLTRNRVFENLTIADQGQATEGVTTFTGGSGGILGQIGEILGQPSLGSGGLGSPTTTMGPINLRPFLAPSDGGTGARLTGGTTGSSAGRSLNPDNFR